MLYTEGFGDVQVFFLMLVYAYILSWASNMISDGSELLLLVPSLRGRLPPFLFFSFFAHFTSSQRFFFGFFC